eukprot:TRINITY_DN17073_c0_g1_i1.p1 TRINITY_DN17073_c0_g1~~TRINITY_DN17073_c0_g1_i1.p1  ORF type:complete len:346 (+),score=86.60 TRINITY_DN17073_c0_g1_i1:36-1073(+)
MRLVSLIVAATTVTLVACASGLPADFGKENGTAVSNKEEILPQVDRMLRADGRPPAVEVIFAEAVTNSLWRTLFSFGHLSVAYRMPGTGERRVMNIVGLPGFEMVNFVNLSDYLFGTTGWEKTEQGGVYNRNFVGVRVEELADSDILAMDHLFQSIRYESVSGRAKFNIDGGHIKAMLSYFVPEAGNSYGNCARWTTKGLVSAGLMRLPSMFPKNALIRIFEDELRNNASNVHLVYYAQAEHAVVKYEGWEYVRAHVSFTNLFSGMQYRDLLQYADLIVEIPNGSIMAVANPGKRKRPIVRIFGTIPYGMNHEHHILLWSLWITLFWYGYKKVLCATVAVYMLFY